MAMKMKNKSKFGGYLTFKRILQSVQFSDDILETYLSRKHICHRTLITRSISQYKKSMPATQGLLLKHMGLVSISGSSRSETVNKRTLHAKSSTSLQNSIKTL